MIIKYIGVKELCISYPIISYASHGAHSTSSPTSVQMTDTMLSLLASSTAKRILAKSRLEMGKEAAKLFQTKFMPLLCVVRTLCSKGREFRDMLRMLKFLGHGEREFQVVMMTVKTQETETWTIPDFMNSLRVQLKKEDHKGVQLDIKTEPKDEVMMEIDPEIIHLVPLDQDGWPILPEDRGSGLQDHHDDSVM